MSKYQDRKPIGPKDDQYFVSSNTKMSIYRSDDKKFVGWDSLLNISKLFDIPQVHLRYRVTNGEWTRFSHNGTEYFAFETL